MQKIDIEQIYSEHFKTVYKYLAGLTHSKEIAEDLTQETFYNAIKHINNFRWECKISVWLCEIAKNLWLNELKKRKKMPFTDINTEEIDVLYNIEENFLMKEEVDVLYNKIQKLDDTIKEILYMKLFSNLTFKEIGEIKGRTEVWARVNFYRGKQKVKEMIESEKRL